MPKKYIAFCQISSKDFRFLTCIAENKDDAIQIFSDIIYAEHNMTNVNFYVQEVYIEDDTIQFAR